ncbi:proteasome subunit alpha type-6-like [Hibiscus syriacus]|uniref:proteasome subunit alpha type-6-like n=1 Tax=Hibiscus syriacus TaxID=106335 RepID=UPI00192138C9|nr:proteasome subunit alpha type-6-like [Hibiscus syriacus]
MVLGIDKEKGPHSTSVIQQAIFMAHQATSAGSKEQEAINFLEKNTKNDPAFTYEETMQERLLLKIILLDLTAPCLLMAKLHVYLSLDWTRYVGSAVTGSGKTDAVRSMIEKLAQYTDIRCCLIVDGLSLKV